MCMSARIPTQHKTPFEIDPRPLDEMASPHAGLLATSRAFRSLRIPDLVAANLKLKKRQRGCSDAQYIESVVLLQTAGGDCPEDMSLLAATIAWSEVWALPCQRPVPCGASSTASMMRV